MVATVCDALNDHRAESGCQEQDAGEARWSPVAPQHEWYDETATLEDEPHPCAAMATRARGAFALVPLQVEERWLEDPLGELARKQAGEAAESAIAREHGRLARADVRATPVRVGRNPACRATPFDRARGSCNAARAGSGHR